MSMVKHAFVKANFRATISTKFDLAKKFYEIGPSMHMSGTTEVKLFSVFETSGLGLVFAGSTLSFNLRGEALTGTSKVEGHA